MVVDHEYDRGVLLVPTLISTVWFVVFGGAGLHLQFAGVDIAGTGSEAAAFFTMLQEYPVLPITAGAVIFLTSTFFVSGADVGALVLATLSSRGREEPWEPLVVLWAMLTGVVAAMLLLVGGLEALQTFTILTATPFVFVLIGLCVSLYLDLRKDPLRKRRLGPVRTQTPPASSPSPFIEAAEVHSGPPGGQDPGGGERT